MKIHTLLLISSFVVSIASCSHGGGAGLNRVSDLSEVGSLAQAQCIDEWRKVLDQWSLDLKQGSDLTDLRRQISLDSSLGFSHMAKSAWLKQVSNAHVNFGYWPVSKAEFLVVSHSVNLSARGQVSRRCEQAASYILPPLLGEKAYVSGSFLGSISFGNINYKDGDVTQVGQWLYYWIFVRVDGRVD